MKYILNPTIIIDQFEDGDMVIIDQQNRTTHLLNQSAALIISIFKDGVETVEDCINVFVKKIDYKETDEEQISSEIKEIIKEFFERGILIEKQNN